MADDQMVQEVVDTLNELVAADGGRLEVQQYQPGDAVLRVDYLMGHNEDCDTCSFTPDLIEAFLLEGLQSRAAGIDEVRVSQVA